MHGLLGYKSNWRSIAGALNEQGVEQVRLVILMPSAKIHCVDMRNHGDSPHSQDVSYRSMAQDVLAFAKDLNSQNGVCLIGHSMGGKTAMTAALMEVSYGSTILLQSAVYC